MTIKKHEIGTWVFLDTQKKKLGNGFRIGFLFGHGEHKGESERDMGYIKIEICTVEKYASQILSAVHELEREITLMKEGGIGELSIALGPYPAEFSGHRAVGRLIKNAPDIRCKVFVESWDEVEKLVMDHQVACPWRS